MPSLFHVLPVLLLSLSSRTFAQSTNANVSAEYTNDDAFQKAVLDTTNLYRSQHDAVELSWNESLAGTAREWSEKCGAVPQAKPSHPATLPQQPRSKWGDERRDYEFKEYEFKKGEFSSETGHFSQLGWRNTASVAVRALSVMAERKGRGGAMGWYLVCNYHPAGNVLGQFTENVD
ncbi:hypothetical protein EKO04_009782 [Ascochyta lentis]|uniref:SCP domain-containing protein n=1 Tax=Ascochyta lentis TaxID=205686 RepID=A0A8H7MEW2_9PLEO|nr:hypothetical protein EKO04_009782 [Ascochyta lentis]